MDSCGNRKQFMGLQANTHTHTHTQHTHTRFQLMHDSLISNDTHGYVRIYFEGFFFLLFM